MNVFLIVILVLIFLFSIYLEFFLDEIDSFIMVFFVLFLFWISVHLFCYFIRFL